MKRYLILLWSLTALGVDLSIIGFIKKADGIGQHAISFFESLKLKADLNKVNFLSTDECVHMGISSDLSYFVEHAPDIRMPQKECSLGKVCIFVDILWRYEYCKNINVDKENQIWVAYSTTESSVLHKPLVDILNQNFDAVCVPDKNLVDVYVASGVEIPIFVLPLALDLDFVPKVDVTKETFTFGYSSGFWERKNHLGLVDAFAKAFKNNHNVFLKLHGRAGETVAELKRAIKKHKLKNRVEIIEGSLSEEAYFDFLSSLDCYVTPSKAEGFSISVREAMALGLPCVVTNHTAHKTICDSGLVYSVECPIKNKAYYEVTRRYAGESFNFHVDDMAKALLEAYNNKDVDKKNCLARRVWAQENYSYSALSNLYYNLVWPSKVMLADVNVVADSGLTTNSQKLFEKYNRLLAPRG